MLWRFVIAVLLCQDLLFATSETEHAGEVSCPSFVQTKNRVSQGNYVQQGDPDDKDEKPPDNNDKDQSQDGDSDANNKDKGDDDDDDDQEEQGEGEDDGKGDSAASTGAQSGDQPQDAVINFASFRDTPLNGQIFRPNWQKMYRCSGPLQSDCEECSALDTPCWTLGQYPKDMTSIAPDTTWTRFLSVIHVTCRSMSKNSLGVSINVTLAENAQLSLYWDDLLINSQNNFTGHLNGVSGLFPMDASQSPLQQVYGWVTIPVDLNGGHQLTLEHTVTSKDSRVEVSSLRFTVVQDFAACQDSKACLSVLNDDEGLELRNSNLMQVKCLTGELPSSQKCTEWRQCLENATNADSGGRTHEQRILDLLAAAGVNTTSFTQIDATQHQSHQKTTSVDCLDPVTEDPESWECDCYDEAVQRCEAVEAAGTVAGFTMVSCLRASFCVHPDVCSDWKQSACVGLDDMTDALQALASTSLLARRISNEERALALDDATTTKACG